MKEKERKRELEKRNSKSEREAKRVSMRVRQLEKRNSTYERERDT